MTEPNILDKILSERHRLLADGATGTNLFAMGLQTGDSPELWNVDHPERIRALYKNFIAAGSDLILTNSFGGNRYRLALHGADKRVQELNHAAASLARNEADQCGHGVLVAGSMGPSGEILQPSGTLSITAAAEAFAEQADALASGGADILWLETLSSLEEVQAAILGATTANLPIVFTMSIDTNGRTMMGVTPHDIIESTRSLEVPVAAIGSNCGVGAAEVVASILNMRSAAAQHSLDPVLVAKANCGIPEYVDGNIVYNGTPEIMRDYTVLAADAGARIIGGCCGTTPRHIEAMRTALDNYVASSAPDLQQIERTLGAVSTGAAAQLRGDLSVSGGSNSGRAPRRGRRRHRSDPAG